MNLCVNSKRSENGKIAEWYLVSDRRELSQEIMTDRYSIRFWIEEGIKDLKSKLHQEQYTEKIPWKDRLIKCVIVSCLSYALQTAVGNQMEISESDGRRTSIFSKFRQKIRRGTEELKRIILNFINIICIYIARTELYFK
jgi:hypothetical protein